MSKLKIFGKIERTKDGNIVLKPSRYVDFQYDPEKDYEIEIGKAFNKRTNNQNRYLWLLVNEICMTEDGNISDADDMYCRLLEMAGAKYETIAIKENAFQGLKKMYRHIKLNTISKGWYICNVYYGSSQMDTKEMGQLIDTAIRYAYNINCPNVRYYEDMLIRNR